MTIIDDYVWLLMIILWIFYSYWWLLTIILWLLVIINYYWWLLIIILWLLMINFFYCVNVVCINADIGQVFFEKYLEKLIWLI